MQVIINNVLPITYHTLLIVDRLYIIEYLTNEREINESSQYAI